MLKRLVRSYKEVAWEALRVQASTTPHMCPRVLRTSLILLLCRIPTSTATSPSTCHTLAMSRTCVPGDVVPMIVKLASISRRAWSTTKRPSNALHRYLLSVLNPRSRRPFPGCFAMFASDVWRGCTTPLLHRAFEPQNKGNTDLVAHC